MRKVTTLFIAFILLLIGLAGCATMKGLGQDIEKLGSKIEKKAGSQ